MQIVHSTFMMDLCVRLISSYSYWCSVCSEIILCVSEIILSKIFV